MKRLTRQELIEALCESMHFARSELSKKTYSELQEHYAELYQGNDPLYPNGRDYDAEDEYGI